MQSAGMVFGRTNETVGIFLNTNARTHTNTFSNGYFYPCHYFLPQVHEIFNLTPCSGLSCGVWLGERG